MKRFFLTHKISTVLLIGCIAIVGYFLFKSLTADPFSDLVTTTVDKGIVETLVSVSGLTTARNTAELAFPSQGVVSRVYVKEGDTVKTGDVLATLGAEQLVATRASALADVRVAEANRTELIQGDTAIDREITDTRVAIAKAELERITETQNVLVENATRALRTGELVARTKNAEETSSAPIISGTYNCKKEGSYELSVYRSGAESGYSIKMSGLEAGTAILSVDQPTPLGVCGLYILFSKEIPYGGTVWQISVPNTSAAGYVTNKNNLNATESTARAAIAAASQALLLAKQEQQSTNATPRSEALERADATIARAKAVIAQIDAQIKDTAVVAPFDGIVTTVNIVSGETAGTVPLFTVLATNDIDLKARIPEIDITSIQAGQKARVVFDADTTTFLTGSVSYISPLPIQIDGVGYFEITVVIDDRPQWLRGGLNADVDVIIESTADALRVPNRYLIDNESGTYVKTLINSTIATSTVTKVREGNDGWIAISGVPEGTTIIAQ